MLFVTSFFLSSSDDYHVGQSTLVAVFECILSAIDDYTTDRRGDVGAWVREASMFVLVELHKQILEENPDLVSDIIVRELMPKLAQQSVEKIDRTRGLAVKMIAEIVFQEVSPFFHRILTNNICRLETFDYRCLLYTSPSPRD